MAKQPEKKQKGTFHEEEELEWNPALFNRPQNITDIGGSDLPHGARLGPEGIHKLAPLQRLQLRFVSAAGEIRKPQMQTAARLSQ